MSKLHIPFWLVLMLVAQLAIAQPKSITILSEASLQPIAQCELQPAVVVMSYRLVER